MLKKVIQFLLNLLKEVGKNNPTVVEEVKKKEEIIKEVMLLKKGSQGEEVKKWSDQAELAFVNTSGNSEATTLAFKNELKYIFSDNNAFPSYSIWID